MGASKDQGFQSVMLELTFGNSAGGEVDGIEASDVSTPAARAWQRLSDVRAAWVAREQLSEAERRDLQRIVDGIPHCWRMEVRRRFTPEPAWAALPGLLSPHGLPIVAERATTGPDRCWEIWPSGRLAPASSRPQGPTISEPRPAMVRLRPKPRWAWVREDFQRAEAGVGVEEEPWLVGFYDAMAVDPGVWGLPATPGVEARPLIDMTTKAARERLTHLDAARDHRGIAGYVAAEAALWPPTWRVGSASTLTQDPVRLSDDQLRRCVGLRCMEERWRRSVEGLAAGRRPAAASPYVREGDGSSPAWMDLRPSVRATPEDRRAARARRAEDGDPGVERPSVGDLERAKHPCDAWKRLKDPTIHRPFRVTAWKVLHGTLGCGAFLSHVQAHSSRPDAARLEDNAKCSGAACLAADDGRLETITHAMLECPDVQPVVAWLCETWRMLAGAAGVRPSDARVPASAEVILLDDPRGWEGAHPPANAATYRLWTRLRVAVLGAIWQRRCEREDAFAGGGMVGEDAGGASFAHRVASLAVDSVVAALQRDWMRTQEDITALDGGGPVATGWWRGCDTSMTVDRFKELWATPPVLCTVAPATASQGEARLTVHLSRTSPLHLPT